MGGIGTGELVLIFMVVLLVFGAKRIPEIARNMGTAMREFKSATREIQRQLDITDNAPPVRPPQYSVSQTKPAQPVTQQDISSSAPDEPAAPAAEAGPSEAQPESGNLTT